MRSVNAGTRRLKSGDGTHDLACHVLRSEANTGEYVGSLAVSEELPWHPEVAYGREYPGIAQ